VRVGIFARMNYAILVSIGAHSYSRVHGIPVGISTAVQACTRLSAHSAAVAVNHQVTIDRSAMEWRPFKQSCGSGSAI